MIGFVSFYSNCCVPESMKNNLNQIIELPAFCTDTLLEIRYLYDIKIYAYLFIAY